ncbi:MAG: alpha/beta hydrolase [Chryseobacterium sp.]|uniref:RHS repeat domain-containing protein n=1 Tax=Chryseobacterium sp. TaxID=1871047 RepID=UPI0025C3E56F|nr:RHS repeat-associated core domain-containing protein [Chryseobacterium sp.]MCJ7932445.1 alpha/beta hydrolase [Chryseobacterium sp.]
MAPAERAMEMEAYSVQPENTATISLKTQDLQFFPTAEGFYDYTKDQYIYSYKDHLGNARVSFGRTSAGALEIVDSNDYYPFGMNHLKTGNAYFGQGSFKNYKYNGKELQETGFYDYGSRQYMPDIVRWGTVDKLSEKYPFASNYAYVLNRPTVAVDPDGKRVYFIGGAGNDQDGWDYINRWARAFASNGINDFYRVNATRGKAGDIEFTTMYRQTGYDKMNNSMSPSAMGGFGTTSYNAYNNETKPVQDDMIDATVSMYQQQLKDNPLKEGEQFNMVGYSYGSVLQAQSALRLADSGQVIDNLVLIGSPISDNSDLMKQLEGNSNIKNVTRYDLKGDALSNPQDIYDYLIKGGLIQGGIQGDNAHHFDAARPGNQADQLMNTIVQWLQQQGVKN